MQIDLPQADLRQRETLKRFESEPLPPRDLNLLALMPSIGKANRAIATLEGLFYGIPNPNVLLSPITTQEAVLSSKIEGTQADLEDVLRFAALHSRTSPGGTPIPPPSAMIRPAAPSRPAHLIPNVADGGLKHHAGGLVVAGSGRCGNALEDRHPWRDTHWCGSKIRNGLCVDGPFQEHLLMKAPHFGHSLFRGHGSSGARL